LRFYKNQADLGNPCAFTKIRRIYRILALYKKTESLRVLKSPRLVEKSTGLEKTGGPHTVRRNLQLLTSSWSG
jgi:hypothetical protein